ncbi:MAG: site-specific DNA-methyltransferase [Phycisphaerales bacterium]|nr:site-specific DNA-methyltransferase [Phycisphaerales bacterium]
MAKKPAAKRTTKKKPAAGKKRKVEQYEHDSAQRLNNPPVGLVTPETDPPPPPERARTQYRYDPHLDPELNFDPQQVRDELADVIEQGLAADNLEAAKAALTELKKAQAPYLNWAGKRERTSFDVPTVSLHVHERIDPRTILEAVKTRNGNGQMPGLFEQPEFNPRLGQAVEFYKHAHEWTNRLIAGDSLLVMNSLLEKEGMAGKVQMVYIDPPYGIRYGSNFQPFVNKRDVKDGKDEDLTREPEMLKAFRDTWELGIHSYLAYLRDRLILARELLHESGSCFVQISDENLHHVREMMDEVFGVENFFSLIAVRKTGGLGASGLPAVCDYLVWYARDKARVKFRQLYRDKSETDVDAAFQPVRKLERLLESGRSNVAIPASATSYITVSLTSSGHTPSCIYSFDFDGRTFEPVTGYSWKPNRSGMESLERAGRLIASGSTLRWVYYREDFPVSALTNSWNDTGGASDKVYVVQTSLKVMERCILLTTDPGDIVFDPTCGSGTAAFVAEQWGRRWITCDTSRVAVALAKQRLATSAFDYYELAHPEQGVAGGFVYKTVPHVTLKSIANNPEIKEGMTREQIDRAIAKYAPQETLYDQPNKDSSRVRVTGPFTVEAVPAPVVAPISDVSLPPASDDSVAREGETLRQSEWRDELLKSGARGEGGMKMEFVRVEPLPGAQWLHAEGEIKEDGEFRGKAWKRGDRVMIAFGPEHAPMEQRFVENAWREAASLHPKPKHVVFAAFQFDPEAAKDIDEIKGTALGMTFYRAEMNDDLHTGDLKKKRSSNESFWFIGQPDVMVEKLTEGDDAGKFVVEVNGFDYFNMKDDTIDSGGPDKIAMWMLDTDYDERSLYPRQVFFPMAGPKDGWSRLARTLKAEVDQDLIEAYRGSRSLPFEAGKHGKIAVKVVDDRGFESLVIRQLPGVATGARQ